MNTPLPPREGGVDIGAVTRDANVHSGRNLAGRDVNDIKVYPGAPHGGPLPGSRCCRPCIRQDFSGAMRCWHAFDP